MTTLGEILQNPEFEPFHVTGKEVNGKFSAFISARDKCNPCLTLKLMMF